MTMPINFQTRGLQYQPQDPDAYAEQYMEQNGLSSIDEAKAELKELNGDPNQAQGPSIFLNNSTSTNAADTNFDFSDIDFEDDSDFLFKSLFQSFLDFLRGGEGPKNEGDPQSHLNPETGEETGPQQIGDYNPTGAQPPEPGVDPYEYAQTYADENGLTLEEAKAQLKELYGDPQAK